jgi:hypothetical protein
VETQINEDVVNTAWDKWVELKEKTSEQLQIALEKKNIIQVNIKPRKLVIPLSKYDIKGSKLLVLDLGCIVMSNQKGDQYYEEKYKMEFESMYIKFFNSFNDMLTDTNGLEIINNVKFGLILGVLTQKQLSRKYPKLLITLNIENANIHLTESIYYTFHFIIDIMKPTKDTDYWGVIERNKPDIKKNTKICGRLMKKNMRFLYYDDFFAVLSGGFIYFYKHADDDHFVSYFYIKEAELTSNKNTLELHVQNRYGVLELQFANDDKLKQWTKVLTERINEMKLYTEPIEKIEEIKAGQTDMTVKKDEMSRGFSDLAEIITFGLEINMSNITCNLLDENDNMLNLFTIRLSNFFLSIIIRDLDITLDMSLGNLAIYDEKYKGNKYFYELLTSVDKDNSDTKLLNIHLLLADPPSPLYKHIGIEMVLNIGYLYCIWQPNSIRRLLHYLAHNDILRDRIKNECLNLKEDEPEKGDKDDKDIVRLTCNTTNELYLQLVVSLQKVHNIWVNPITNIYLMSVALEESHLNIEMSLDDFSIKGTLGNLKLHDLTNYPYTITSMNDYNPNKYTEILGFKDNNSMSLEYHSYAIYCPKCKDNYTSKAIVNFNSVRFTYIQEYFFRFFNFLFAEFLGALKPHQSIRDYKNEKDRISIIKKEDIEFMDLLVTFNNPQVLLKARQRFEDCFLADLGTVTITNSYDKEQGRIRSDPNIERYISIYHFDIRNLFIITHDGFKFVENTDCKVDMIFSNLLEIDKPLTDLEIDRSFEIKLFMESININMRQSDYTYIMKCNDLNLLYSDGEDANYQYQQDIQIPINHEGLEYSDFNSLITVLKFPNISLRLYQDKKIFTELALKDMVLYFEKKLNFKKEMDIQIRCCEMYNYLGIENKEIMLTYYEDSDIKAVDQFNIKMIIDQVGEKNIIIKIYNIKMTLRLDTLQLIRTFFTHGMPYYDETEKDLPNQCKNVF